MHDYFWSEAGRQDWPDPEPTRAMFLGRFLIALGSLKYGGTWDGIEGRPSRVTSISLQKQIGQQAAGGILRTLVLHPKTFEFQPIPVAAWRKDAAHAAKFSRCLINALDPLSSLADGRYHGSIFIERYDAEAYLEKMLQPFESTVLGRIYRDRHLSTYIRYVIERAQAEQFDENEPWRAGDVNKLKARIRDNWKAWRQDLAGSMTLPDIAAELSENVVNGMALLMRGEKLRLIKGGGVEKHSKVDESDAEQALK